jgi:hypothetical protein
VRRVILAFVVIPLLYPLSGLVSGDQQGIAGAIWIASFTIPATVVIGIPLFVLFRRRAWFQWWHFLVGGLVIGLACALPFLFRGWEIAALFAPYFAVFGLLHGAAFWLLAIWRNTGLTSRSTGRPDGGTSCPPRGAG